MDPVLRACSVLWLCMTLSKSFYHSDPLSPHLQNGNILLLCWVSECGHGEQKPRTVSGMMRISDLMMERHGVSLWGGVFRVRTSPRENNL